MDFSDDFGLNSALSMLRTGAPLGYREYCAWESAEAERPRSHQPRPVVMIRPPPAVARTAGGADHWEAFYKAACLPGSAARQADLIAVIADTDEEDDDDSEIDDGEGDAAADTGAMSDGEGDVAGGDVDGATAAAAAVASVAATGDSHGASTSPVQAHQTTPESARPVLAQPVVSTPSPVGGTASPLPPLATPGTGALAMKRGSLLTEVLRSTTAAGARGFDFAGPSGIDEGDAPALDGHAARRGGLAGLGARSTTSSKGSGHDPGFRAAVAPTAAAAPAPGAAAPPAGSGTVSAAESVSSAGALSVKVYLPHKKQVRLRVPEAALVADVISEVLRMSRGGGGGGGAALEPLVGDVKCYELRLHDEDGEPDDDVPALDRTRRIANFAQGGVHEYVLKPLAGALAVWRAANPGGGAGAVVGGGAATPTTPAAGAGAAAAAPAPEASTPVMSARPGIAVGGARAAVAATATPPATGSGGGARSPPRAPLMTPVGAGTPMGGAAAAGGSPPPLLLAPPPSLRVVTPGHPTPTVTMVPLHAGMRVQEAVEYVGRRLRLPVFHERYVLRVTAMEQVRLSLASRELPPQALLEHIAVDSVELVKKAFADAPTVPAHERGSVTAAGGAGAGAGFGEARRASAMAAAAAATAPTVGHRGGGDHAAAAAAAAGGAGAGDDDDTGTVTGGRPSRSLAKPTVAPMLGPGGLMHNAITASEFQEWRVIKVNKRGRPQERLMGVDLTRITNRKVDKFRYFSDKTTTAERLIADIVRVEVSDSAKTLFSITFREAHGDDTKLVYETSTPLEREEIISKLAYILRMSGDAEARKVVRVA